MLAAAPQPHPSSSHPHPLSLLLTLCACLPLCHGFTGPHSLYLFPTQPPSVQRGTVSLRHYIQRSTFSSVACWLSSISACLWATAFGIWIKSTLSSSLSLLLLTLWACVTRDRRQWPPMCLYVLLATELWLPALLLDLTSQNFYHWPVTERMMMGNLCFPFDSWCFLFSSASHFLGKPAVLISDTHVHRAPQSLKFNRLRKEFPDFILICMEI